MARAHAVALGLVTLAGALAVAAIGGALVVGMSYSEAVDYYLVTNAAIGLVAVPSGYLVLRSLPGHRIGWLLVGLGLAPLASAAAVPLRIHGVAQGWPEPALRLLVTVEMGAWGLGLFFCLPMALLLFPDGRLPGRRWRPVLWYVVLVTVVGSYATGSTPDLGADSYLVLPGHEVAEGLLGFSVLVWPLTIAAPVVRFRRAPPLVRRQLMWLMLAVLVAIGLNVPWAFALHSGAAILFILAFAVIPPAMAIGLVRPDVLDVRLAVARLALYELLTAAVVLLYLGLVALLEMLLSGAGAPVLATVAVALAFNPIRVRLQRAVDRTFYGSARDPVRAMSAVGSQLSGGDLGAILEAVRDSLRVPYAAVEAGDLVVTSGTPGSPLHRIRLADRDGDVGALVVGARWGQGRLTAADRGVLELIATPLSVAVRATSLATEVQASRTRVVAAAAEERRRLHRELHDSLGPVLTGAALTADSAAMAAVGDPARAERLATELAAQLRQAIADVRRLVYGLRPPVLDELGLVAALRCQEGRLGHLGLHVETLTRLPVLPAAVEVAAYRIASEAITNVVRHSGASRAVVTLAAESDGLRLVVADDGPTHAPGDWAQGVGLESIRQRVKDLGGDCEAGPTPDGGRVSVLLPLQVGS